MPPTRLAPAKYKAAKRTEQREQIESAAKRANPNRVHCAARSRPEGGILTRVIAYLRVSTAEQGESGAGLAAQRAAILAEAQRRGWREADIEWIQDIASGKDRKRPGLKLALDALEHAEASTLVVAKMDRLSRSLLDFTSIMAEAQKQGWTLLALDSPADTSTAAGEAMANVMMTFSQLERRLIGERTKAALAARKAEGVKLGGARPGGGRRSGIPSEIRTRIHRERETGRSLGAIAKALNDDGVPTAQGGARWHKSTVRLIAEGKIDEL
jgi:DNA invertase Pin-like site-specific DNA recombinase